MVPQQVRLLRYGLKTMNKKHCHLSCCIQVDVLPRRIAAVVALGAVLCLSCAGVAQSFYDQIEPVATTEDGQPDPDASLRAMSMMYIVVPKPKPFQIHDLITIIVDETSSSESKQSLDTKKKYDFEAILTEFPSLAHLLELQLTRGDSSPVAKALLNSDTKFKGDGKAKREDRYIARITAEVIDIKPNGTLVLESRKSIHQGAESKTIVLSGICRQQDITDANTISSSQLANLNIIEQVEGELKKTATKGFLTRVLEAIFNF